MTDSIEETLQKKWGRTLVEYIPGFDIYTLYKQEALTGWVLILPAPMMVEFNDIKCIGVNLSEWIMIKHLGHETVTPFRVVAKGKGLVEKAFMPHTGLKYAVRNVEGTPVVHIPVEDFKSV